MSASRDKFWSCLLILGLLVTIFFLLRARSAGSAPNNDAAAETNSAPAASATELHTRGVPRRGDTFGTSKREQRAAALRAGETMRNHYARFFSSVNPGYTNVFKSLKDVSDHDVLGTDCFKDACAYVALRTQLNEWAKNEEEHIERLTERQVETINDPNALEKAANANQELLRSVQTGYQKVLPAYRKIFAHRFQEFHGMDSEAVLSELDRLTLSNAGPELVIPRP